MIVCVVFVRVYVWTDDHGRKLKCSAPLYFDYAMSYIQELLTDEDVFPTKAGKLHWCYIFMLHCSASHTHSQSHDYLIPLFQVQCFRQASSFWSRRCFCCISGLWLTFTGLTTERRWLWACTHTSTHSSHTSHSSAGSTPCWSRRTLSRCRTSSQLWDSTAEPKEQTYSKTLTFSSHLFTCYILLWSSVVSLTTLGQTHSQYGFSF